MGILVVFIFALMAFPQWAMPISVGGVLAFVILQLIENYVMLKKWLSGIKSSPVIVKEREAS